MTQYDAGPGDYSDREWEAPDKRPAPHARRRGPTLPPWALLAGVVGLVILLCVGLILLVRAIRGAGADETPTPAVTTTRQVVPIATWTPRATEVVTQTATPTVVLPTGPTVQPGGFTEIAPGATVVVGDTGGVGLNLRAQPTTGGALVINVKDGAVLTVLEGPTQADGFTWWKLRTQDGKEGWGAADWLRLQTNP